MGGAKVFLTLLKRIMQTWRPGRFLPNISLAVESIEEKNPNGNTHQSVSGGQA